MEYVKLKNIFLKANTGEFFEKETVINCLDTKTY